LEGSTICDVEKLVITNGTGDVNNDKFIVDSCDGQTSIRGDLRIGESDFTKFVVDSEQGNTTITEGNLVIKTVTNDTRLTFQNTSGNLTISGILRTQGTAANILSGDLSVEGGDFSVIADQQINVFPSTVGPIAVGDSIFNINNDGSIDFAKQRGFFSPTGGRKWEFVGGGIQFINVVSNVNYFVAPTTTAYVLLPQNPTHGDMIRLIEVGGNLTYNISLIIRVPNNGKIQGDSDNSGTVPGLGAEYTGGELVIQTPNAALGLVYLGTQDFKGSTTGAGDFSGWWLMEI
jgi:hypothetical protein